MMQNLRQLWLCIAAAMVGGVAMTTGAIAQEFPVKPIEMWVGFAAGGSTDVQARLLASGMEEALGQPVVVINKGGAGGAVMAAQLKSATPDGYTIGVNISQAYSTTPYISDNSSYFASDFVHFASVSNAQCAIVTNVESEYETFEDLIEAGKNGHTITYVSQTPVHKSVMDFIGGAAGVNYSVVTATSSGALAQQILGNHADVAFSGGDYAEHVEAGTMRILAAATAQRLVNAPNVPTLMELGYDIASCSYLIVSGPKGIPDDIAEELASAIEVAANSASMQELLANLKRPAFYNGPAAVSELMRVDDATWGRIAKQLDWPGAPK